MAFQEAGQFKNQQREKLQWDRLTRNFCPACSSKKTLSSFGERIGCNDCGFKIRPEKMQEIVMNILEDDGRDDEWEDWNSMCHGCGKPDLICSCYD